MEYQRFLVAVIITIAFSCGKLIAQDRPEIEIVKYSWAKERIAWESNPLSATVENADQVRDRVRSERRVTSALEERANKATKEEQKKPTEPPRYVFNYKLVIQNDTKKAIKEIDWDYLFTDDSSGELLGRREFTSVEKIGAGKKKELSVRVSSPPTHTISVYKLGENEGTGLKQTIVILRILYEDGTQWKANLNLPLTYSVP